MRTLLAILPVLLVTSCGELTPLDAVRGEAEGDWAPAPAPGFMDPTMDGLQGAACAFSEDVWQTSALPLLEDRWSQVQRIELGSRVLESPQDLLDLLASADDHSRQRAVLALNLALHDAGIYGRYADLGSARLTSGSSAGSTARDLLSSALQLTASVEDLRSFNEGFAGCDPEWYTSWCDDLDWDGVPGDLDCNDLDHRVGTVLYEDDLGVDSGYLATTPQLDDPWLWDGDSVMATDGSQQALLGEDEGWDDVVVFARLSSEGTKDNCAPVDPCDARPRITNRWRAGVLLRAQLDSDQNEGYHGYRCALSRNKKDDCFPAGHFLQIGEFKDEPEDDLITECNDDCPENTTFAELARVDHDGSLDISVGDVSDLEFWIVGQQMFCQASDKCGVPHVSATASDGSFAAGGTGFATLNMFGDFMDVQVCEAYDLP